MATRAAQAACAAELVGLPSGLLFRVNRFAREFGELGRLAANFHAPSGPARCSLLSSMSEIRMLQIYRFESANKRHSLNFTNLLDSPLVNLFASKSFSSPDRLAGAIETNAGTSACFGVSLVFATWAPRMSSKS